jgi:hypothetical protein
MSNKKYPVKIMEQRRSKERGKNGEYTIYLVTTKDLVVPGYTKKDGTRVDDEFLPRGSFVDLVSCPTDEEIDNAKSEAAANYLKSRQEKWGKNYKGEGDPELLRKEYHVRPKEEPKV